MAHKKEEGTYHCNEKCLHSSALGKACLSSGINKGRRVPDRSKTAHRKPFVKCFLTLPPILLYFLKEKGPDQMSFVSINQPYRKAMINNKYNYQDNHQSYSSRPDAVGNTLIPSCGSSPDNRSASCPAVEEGRRLEKVSKISFCSNCTFREALSCEWNLICSQ